MVAPQQKLEEKKKTEKNILREIADLITEAVATKGGARNPKQTLDEQLRDYEKIALQQQPKKNLMGAVPVAVEIEGKKLEIPQEVIKDVAKLVDALEQGKVKWVV
ncbi:MAG: hypothetical protein ABII22_01400 [Candidatus Micrarchaeota archaeon]